MGVEAVKHIPIIVPYILCDKSFILINRIIHVNGELNGRGAPSVIWLLPLKNRYVAEEQFGRKKNLVMDRVRNICIKYCLR